MAIDSVSTSLPNGVPQASAPPTQATVEAPSANNIETDPLAGQASGIQDAAVISLSGGADPQPSASSIQIGQDSGSSLDSGDGGSTLAVA